MTSLTPLLWRHYPLYYDVTHSSTMTSPPLYYDVAHSSTMTSLSLLLWRHYPLYYDVTNPSTMASLTSTMTSLTPLLWRHHPSTITSPTPLLWRHRPSTMTSPPLYYDVTTPLLWRRSLLLYYNVGVYILLMFAYIIFMYANIHTLTFHSCWVSFVYLVMSKRVSSSFLKSGFYK